MTISTTASRKNYTGNGSTTVFSFPYKFLADADILVYLDDVLQTLTTHYTLTGAGGASGGDVTFVTAPASAVRVTIVRSTPLTQETDYISGDAFPAETHESALDKNIMGLQDARESFLNRTVMLATSAEGSLTPISETIAGRANKYVYFDASGDVDLSAALVPGVTASAAEINALDGVLSYTTYTPTVKFGGNNTGITYTAQNGAYHQVGKMVFYTFMVWLSSKGTATGSITISMPKPVDSVLANTSLDFGGIVSSYSSMGFTDKTITLSAIDYSDELSMYVGGGTPVDDADCTNTTIIKGTITYLTD